MNFLIVYATTEGQTQKISARIAEHIVLKGHQCELLDSSSAITNLEAHKFDAFIIAASVHQEQHQETMVNFVEAHRKELQSKPTAFISVSLSAALEDDIKVAQSYVDKFVETTKWSPDCTHLAAGALRFTQYDYFKQQVVKFIVMKKAGPVDTERDYEFTDWTKLFAFVDEFLEKYAARLGQKSE